MSERDPEDAARRRRRGTARHGRRERARYRARLGAPRGHGPSRLLSFSARSVSVFPARSGRVTGLKRSHRAMNRVEYRRTVEGLAEMTGRRRPPDARDGRRIVMAGDEDDRDRQAVVQIEPTEVIHVDVEDETGCPLVRKPREELTRRRERLGLVAGRL